MSQHEFGMSRLPHEHVARPNDTVAPQHDAAATTTPDADDTPTTDRQRFTMTVEGVAALLHTQGLDRDARTIQRWCKSGKIAAIADFENDGRWLIDPATVQPVIDDIVADMERKPRPFTPTSAHASDHVATSSRQPDDTTQSMFAEQPDTARDTAPTSSEGVGADGNVAATSSEEPNDVAALRKKLSDTETELAVAKADLEVRTQMVTYLKEQFSDMLDGHLESATEVGRLKGENEMLRALLPPGTAGRGTQEDMNLDSYEPSNPEIH